MERHLHVTFVVVLLTSLSGEILGQPSRSPSRGQRPTSEECAVFKASDADTLHSGKSTFIEIGEMDIQNSFDLQMEVFPSAMNHNGILFSLGSRRSFEYYEWKTAAVNTQFIVVEFIFSALALTLKALGTQHLHQIEIYKTYPVPYVIDDADWHTVRISRQNDEWLIRIDDKEKREVVKNETNVQLVRKPAFIGGRPNYTDHQFQGIIRKLRINQRLVQLSGRPNDGFAEVHFCRADAVSQFKSYLVQQKRPPRR